MDWKRVEKDVNKAKKQLKKGTNQAAPELNTLFEKVRPQHFMYCFILTYYKLHCCFIVLNLKAQLIRLCSPSNKLRVIELFAVTFSKMLDLQPHSVYFSFALEVLYLETICAIVAWTFHMKEHLLLFSALENQLGESVKKII